MNKITHTKETLKIFLSHALRHKWKMFFILLLVVLVTVMQTIIPIYYKDLINIITEKTGNNLYNETVKILLIILFLNIIHVAMWRTMNFINNAFQPRLMANLTNTCFNYLHKHSYNFFAGTFVGSLVTKVKRFERSFEVISDQIVYEIGRNILIVAFILFVMFKSYESLAWIFLLWCVGYVAFAFFFAKYKLPYDIKRADADTNTTAILADSITNNVNIKLFTGYERESGQFYSTTDKQFMARKKSWDLAQVGEIFQSILMVFLEFYLMYLAVKMFMAGKILVGDVALIQAYLMRIFDRLWNTGKQIRAIYEALADADEMTEMLTSPHEIKDCYNAKQLIPKNGQIHFKNVFYKYPNGVSVFENFNLSIPAGQRVALIGPSGGGKTTITKLLFRFMDVQKGTIEIDGQNIKTATQDSLREVMSLVPQDPILFHRSLMENIRYAKPTSSDKEVIAAAKLAHAHEFISNFPLKYETLVGERGIKLSGGERQRVAIARAILKNAPILILDEATSSLDSESEMLIQDALKELMKGKTVIVIAHRLSTIMQMDRIVVIEDGKITEEGKHEELLKAKQGTYQKLWQIQAGGFMPDYA